MIQHQSDRDVNREEGVVPALRHNEKLAACFFEGQVRARAGEGR
jgi:hypothetical protein